MRTTEEIYQEMLAAFAKRAGRTVDDACELAVRLYALAAQVQALECQTEWTLEQSFPQTAQGEYLDRHAAMRGITRQPAARAAGTLRFYTEEPAADTLTIPAGSVCMTEDAVRFQTTETAVLKAGEQTADAAAEAMEPGTAGNAAAETVTLLTECPVGIAGCVNVEPFSGGSGAEDDETLRARVLESYQRLPNGANAAFYEEQALRHEGVAAAQAVGRARGIGTVDVYIAALSGAPDAALIEEVQADLQAKREIAVDVQVLSPSVEKVDVTVELDAGESDFSAVKEAVSRAAAAWFTGRLLGKPVLLAELGRLIFSVDGVKNYHILAPTADTPGSAAVLPALGTLTVRQMEA